jgi:hypothetical protein
MFKKTYLTKILFALTVLSLFVACDKDYNELGTDIVGDDHFGFDRYTGATVKAYNQKLGPIASNNLPINALGFYANPAFGTTQANFVTQVELDDEDPTFNNTDPSDYQNLPEIDSVILNVPYFSTLKETDSRNRKTYDLDSIYGPTESKFQLSVYQSNYFLRDLDPSQGLAERQLYYTDMDAVINANRISVLLNDSPNPNENTQFYFDKREHMTPVPNEDDETVLDSLRSVPSMRLHLKKSVFTNLLFGSSTTHLESNTAFKNYFRGLYFKVENGNPGQMAMINFKGGTITVHYKEDKKKTVDGQTTFERVRKTLSMSLAGNTVSLLNNSNENNDYLTATADAANEAEKLYLKGGQGAMAVIDVFGPDADNDGIADEIETIKANGWLINEANLTFYVDRIAMQDDRTIEPLRVFLYDMNNKKVLVDYTYDFTTNSAYPKFAKYVHSGILEVDEDDERGVRYKVRITNHVRDLISKDSTNVRLGLSVTETINNVGFSKLKTANSNTDGAPSMSVLSPLGTVLYGSHPNVPDDKRLKLEIYYTKPD